MQLLIDQDEMQVLSRLSYELGACSGKTIARNGLHPFLETLNSLKGEMENGGQNPQAVAIVSLMKFIEGFHEALSTRLALDLDGKEILANVKGK